MSVRRFVNAVPTRQMMATPSSIALSMRGLSSNPNAPSGGAKGYLHSNMNAHSWERQMSEEELEKAMQRDVPQTAGLRNVDDNDQNRVTWFDYKVHPALRFYMYAVRHVRRLPENRQVYYLSLLQQETRGGMFINNTFDVMSNIANGYFKVKWVVNKYGCQLDPIPSPFDVFNDPDYYEERLFAHRRANLMKELQGEQRDVEGMPGMGAVPQFNQLNAGLAIKLQGETSKASIAPYTPHAADMPAPSESEVSHSTTDAFVDAKQHLHVSSGDADRMMNPVRRAKQQQKDADGQELFSFEDED